MRDSVVRIEKDEKCGEREEEQEFLHACQSACMAVCE
jgi:hypothetical protein